MTLEQLQEIEELLRQFEELVPKTRKAVQTRIAKAQKASLKKSWLDEPLDNGGFPPVRF
jgi:hypothetical protein